MMRVLVIGYGHPLEDDDGLGWQIARGLKSDDIDAEISVLTRRLLLPELATAIGRAQLVIFVDEFARGQPGSIICQPITPDSALYPVFSPQYDPRAFLSWVHRFYGYQPRAFLISLATRPCDRNRHPQKNPALPHLLDRIRFLIKCNLLQSAGDAGPEHRRQLPLVQGPGIPPASRPSSQTKTT